MDSLTHVLSGVVMAKAGLAERYGRGTTLFLVVTASLPDIDALLGFVVEDAFLYRRGLTHSVVGIPFLALGAAAIARVWCRAIPFMALFRMGLAAIVLHVLLDLLNSYGVMLLAPFSNHRFELAWVFIIDLVVWGVLFAPLVLAWTRARGLSSPRVSRWALVVLTLYVAAVGGMRARASQLLAATIAQEELRPEFRYVFPEALGTHRFRGVVREGREYRVYLVDVPRGSTSLVKTFETELDDPDVRLARESERGRKLEWFFKAPVWKGVEPAGEGTTAEGEVFDLRFASAVMRSEEIPFLKRVAADARGDGEASEPAGR